MTLDFGRFVTDFGFTFDHLERRANFVQDALSGACMPWPISLRTFQSPEWACARPQSVYRGMLSELVSCLIPGPDTDAGANATNDQNSTHFP